MSENADKQAVAPLDYSGRRHPFDGVAGWVVSLVLHLLLLVAFTSITWVSGGVALEGESTAREAGIVTLDEVPPIEPGEARPIEIAGSEAKLLVPDFRATTKIEPIPTMGASRSPSAETDVLIGLEMGSAASAATVKGDWGALAGGGALGGGGGGTSFFGLQARGGKCVFVVDRSGSMRGPKLAMAKEEMRNAIEKLTSARKFYIIFFDHGHKAMPATELVRATRHNKNLYFEWIDGIRSGGGTDPRKAMKLALSLRPNTIWLLSDGVFNNPPAAIELIRRENHNRRIQIHTIAFWDDSGKEVLKQIARENHGQYRFVPPAKFRPRKPR